MGFFSSDTTGQRFAHGIRRDVSFIKRAIVGPEGSMRRRAHKSGIEWMKWNIGTQELPAGMKLGARIFSRGIGPAFMLWEAYQGYQEGGIVGAAKGVAKGFAYNYALGYASKLATVAGAKALGVAAVGAGVGLAGAAGYASLTGTSLSNVLSPLARPWVHDYAKKFRNLEMGAPVADPFGTVATMRQRSIMAIQNSRINGRGALGNEALLLWSPYWK